MQIYSSKMSPLHTATRKLDFKGLIPRVFPKTVSHIHHKSLLEMNDAELTTYFKRKPRK